MMPKSSVTADMPAVVIAVEDKTQMLDKRERIFVYCARGSIVYPKLNV
jgi:hypothetical protein